MNGRKNLLIINTTQFGYHTDSYMYCKYIDKSRFNLTYFCFDMGFPKINLDNINVNYVQLHSSKILRFLIFIKDLAKFLKSAKIDSVFHVYNKFTLFTRLFFISYPAILDIRTGSINKSNIIRGWKNFEIKLTTFFYTRVSVISLSLANELNISKKKRCLLPLGGQLVYNKSKQFKTIRLLYLGTLENRDIHETIYGLALFLEKFPNELIHYDVVGSGDNNSLSKVKDAIKEKKLEDIVFLHGRKNQDELFKFFNECNIGVVYVPVTKWYNFQPSTKLFECVLAGMPVIATDTFENSRVMKENTGVLCNSNRVSFCEALIKIVANRMKWESKIIKESFQNYTWDYIVKNHFEVLF